MRKIVQNFRQFDNPGGISWQDQAWQGTQSTMNQPTVTMAEMLQHQQRKQRNGSSKSLHQVAQQADWAQQQQFNPRLMNPMMMAQLAAAGNPMMAQLAATNPALHRSMHELSQGGGQESFFVHLDS